MKRADISFFVYRLQHMLYVRFYVLAIQSVRLYKRMRRRFVKHLRRFLHHFTVILYLLITAPIGMVYNGLRKPTRSFSATIIGAYRLVGFTAACVLLFLCVAAQADCVLAQAVTYRGQHIGYVASADVLQEGMATAQQMMQFFDVKEQPRTVFTVVSNDKLSDADTISNAIIAEHSDELATSDGLFIDEKYIGAVTDSNALQALLEDIRTANDDGTESKPSVFVQNVKVLSGAYPKNTVISSAEMRQKLEATKTNPQYYTAVSGDSLIRIARVHGLSLAELRQKNPAFQSTDVLHIGDRLLVKEATALLQVCRYVTREYTETIPYETKIYYDDGHYANEQRIVQHGVNGKREVKAEIAYVDGVESQRTVLKSTTIKKAITKKIQMGTINGSRPQSSGVATGSFKWPLPHFKTITSPYGARWGTMHQGIDISGYNAYGASIVAADGGTVYAVNRTHSWGTGIFAGYGYAVIIDHGGGMRTLYAHCSDVIVNPGQRVDKGQTIAFVGNTGMSTGPHLHFEIRVNNKRVNPLPYLQ